jgi:hypothetical protein
MKSSLWIIALLTAALLPPRLAAQTDDIQDQVDFRLKMERFMKEALQKQEELWKEFKKLQADVQDLKDRLKSPPKTEALKDELEQWKARLDESARRLTLARAALEKAQNDALMEELRYRDLEEKVRVLMKLFPEKKEEKKDPDKTKDVTQGKVKKIAADDPELLDFDIGREQGLKDGQTVYVYRLESDPKSKESTWRLIAPVRLIQVRPSISTGRVLTAFPGKGPAVKVGDTVTPELKKMPSKTF